MRRLWLTAPLALTIFLCLAAAPASATYFRISTNTTFDNNGVGDFSTDGDSSGDLNFSVSNTGIANTIFQLVDLSSAPFTLRVGTLTLDDNWEITSSEDDNLTMRIRFTVYYGPTNTIAGTPNLLGIYDLVIGPSAFTVQTGSVSDSASNNESNPWDVRMDYSGVSASYLVPGDNLYLVARVTGGDSSPGANPIYFNWDGDSENFYVTFNLDTPEPGTFVLVIPALAGLALLRRRRLQS